MSDGYLRLSDLDFAGANAALAEYLRENAERQRPRSPGRPQELPVMLCEEVPPTRRGAVTTWRFWCDYCRRWHSHGAGEGHRVAHCINQESPYLNGGYVLKLKAHT
jgi:hypothetical protein